MNLHVGFFKLVSTPEEKWMLGALLVTDDLGKPEEFRVTYPVRPTLIQRQLYGDSLVPHVAIELCGKPLVQSLRQKPHLLVIADRRILPLADHIPINLVYLESAGEALVVKEERAAGIGQKFQSPSGRFQPMTAIYPSAYPQERRRETAEQIAKAFEGLDLLEPFNRIDIAIQTLTAQDERFR